jgi:FkbM family methyltransferase
MGEERTLKAIRLSAVAAVTIFACLAYFYVFEHPQLSLTYRCWRDAVNISRCYHGESFDFIVDLNGLRYEGNTANYIDKNIFYYGAYEKPVLFFLRDIMTSAYSDQGIFLDIGANTGQHSLFMSRYAKEIHAFEPWEPVLKKLRRHVEINRLKNIVIHPFGLGNENSKQPFYRPPDNNLGMGSFVKEFAATNSPEGILEIRIGDEVLEKSRVSSVALIKMDIEGYEKPALKGLEGMLRKHRPIVEFELTTDPKSPVSVKSHEELLALFPENYEFLTFSERSDPTTGVYVLEPIAGLLRFDKREQHDIVAYPIEKKKFIVRPDTVHETKGLVEVVK